MNSELTLGGQAWRGEGDITSTVGSYYEYELGFIRVNGVNYPIKRRMVYLGYLPNNNVQEYSTGITNMNGMISISVIADDGSYCRPIPFVGTSTLASQINMSYNKSSNKISITTGTDRSTNKAVGVIEYY